MCWSLSKENHSTHSWGVPEVGISLRGRFKVIGAAVDLEIKFLDKINASSQHISIKETVLLFDCHHPSCPPAVHYLDIRELYTAIFPLPMDVRVDTVRVAQDVTGVYSRKLVRSSAEPHEIAAISSCKRASRQAFEGKICGVSSLPNA